MKIPFIVIQAIVAAGKAIVLSALKILKPNLKRPEEKVALEIVEDVIEESTKP